jgi:hypothetical protein
MNAPEHPTASVFLPESWVPPEMPSGSTASSLESPFHSLNLQTSPAALRAVRAAPVSFV